jgi:DNA-directed RNA polymerase sigma subunit (sigma70/sigma32)
LQERQVIEQRYQIGSEAEYGAEDIPLAYTEVGKRLGMTAYAVKTVEARALLKIRFWAERESQLVARSSGEMRAS